MNPSDDEINKTIAEFMGDDGYCFVQTGILPKNYTESLDALIPVVEKIFAKHADCDGAIRYAIEYWKHHKDEYECGLYLVRNDPEYEIEDIVSSAGKSPSRALAGACAGVIKEIRGE